ncbi:hypothetical protein [Candidatus Tisiphia endosymbiont of Parasteatoda lunata]|uniref:hypothetical protein n=1 Tax=Candidatus Tisiphia endosymbiont of Parasteatoda lunata TaxID=3066275 RepID=UPI00313F05E7
MPTLIKDIFMPKLEKFKSDIANIVGEPKEGFVQDIDRFKSLLNFSFDSKYTPELAEAMESMGIEKEVKIQVSLDDDSTNVLSQAVETTDQKFGEFKGNISTTLDAHGKLAKGYSAEYVKGQPNLDKFGKQAKQMDTLIEEFPHKSLQKTEQIETIATIGAGTEKMYSALEFSPADPVHVRTITDLGAKLRHYIKSFVKSPEEQKEAFIENGVGTIQAIDKANRSDGLQTSKTALEKILSKLESTAGSQIYHRLRETFNKNDISMGNGSSTIKPNTTPSNTKHSNKDKGR